MDIAYDIERGQFKRKNGRLYMVDGYEELKQKIYKCLMTKRNTYRAYTAEYGADIQRILRSTKDGIIAGDLIFEEIKKALLKIKGVREIKDYSFRKDGGKAYIGFCVKTDYGDMEMEEYV